MSERDDLFGDDSPEEKKVLKRREDEEFFFDIDEEDLQDSESRDADEQAVESGTFMSSEEVPPLEVADDFEDEEPPAEPEPVVVKKGGGSRSKLFLLLLLIVVLLGGGYFYMGDILFMPEPEPVKPVVKSQAQKMKVPQRKEVKQEQAAVKEEVMPAEKIAAAPPEKPTQKSMVPEARDENPAPAEAAKAMQKMAPVEKQAAESEAMETPTAVVKPEAVAMEKQVEKAQPEAITVSEKAPYALQIGAFVLESNLTEALKTVKSLGYQPTIIEGKKSVVMTRLKVGSYPPAEARKKLQEIKQLVPSAFLLKDGNQLTVYAGSYYITDRARSQADRLFQHEIRVDEVNVDVSVPIKSIRFGAFDSPASAEKAVAQAAQAGLETLVIKQN